MGLGNSCRAGQRVGLTVNSARAEVRDWEGCVPFPETPPLHQVPDHDQKKKCHGSPDYEYFPLNF